MSRQWVLNASPTILLAKIGFLEHLLTLCPQPVIPQGVYEEILMGAVDDPARRWLSQQGKQWVQADKPVVPAIAAWDLGLGETQVLSGVMALPSMKPYWMMVRRVNVLRHWVFQCAGH